MVSPRLKGLAGFTALFVALMIVMALVSILSRPSPRVIEATYGEAMVRFAADRTTVLFFEECIPVRWHVEHIQGVKFDGQAVVGEGTEQSCASRDTELKVFFQDGTTQNYHLEKEFLIEQRPVRLLLLLVVGLVGGGFWLLVDAWKTSRLAPSRWRSPSVSPSAPLTDRLGWLASSRLALSNVDWTLLVALILLGTALRVTYLSQPMHTDESWSYLDFASQPLSIGLVNYWSTNNHIFHTLLMHLSVALFGNHEWALRLPVFFAGVLLIAATFRLAAALANRRVALVAAGFVAVSAPLIEYSTNARGYMIVLLLFVLQVLVGVYLLRRNSRARWLLFALLGAYSLYTVPTAMYGLGGIFLWLFILIVFDHRGRQRRALLRNLVVSSLVTGVLTGLLYLPVLLYMTSHTFETLDLGHLNPAHWNDIVRSVQQTGSTTWSNWQGEFPVFLGWLLPLGFVFDVLVPGRSARLRRTLVFAMILWIVPFFFIHFVVTFERVWLFLLPLYLIVAIAGVSRVLAWLLELLQQLLRVKLGRIPAPLFAAGALALAVILGVLVLKSPSILWQGGAYLDAEALALYASEEMQSADVLLCGNACWPVWYISISTMCRSKRLNVS